MYLIASRLDIMFDTGLWAQYQPDPEVSHFTAVKQIFRYPKRSKAMGIWYLTGNDFNLQAFTNVDHAGYKLE